MIRHFVYDCLRRLTPGWARRWLKSRRWFYPVAKTLFNNAVYSDSYYKDVERIEAESSTHIAEWICSRLRPRRVLDVGCGPGHMMQALSRHGCQVFGVDISPQALARVAAKGLPGRRHDLTEAGKRFTGIPYDLVLCCEVAEHLEPRYARLFVQKLTRAGDMIYMTAAEPDAAGPGLYHVNEQPNEYWVGLMESQGFELDRSTTADARTALQNRAVVAYLAKPMIFRRQGAPSESEATRGV